MTLDDETLSEIWDKIREHRWYDVSKVYKPSHIDKMFESISKLGKEHHRILNISKKDRQRMFELKSVRGKIYEQISEEVKHETRLRASKFGGRLTEVLRRFEKPMEKKAAAYLLAAEWGINPETLRRDISALYLSGLLIRVSLGVYVLSPFGKRLVKEIEEKQG